MKCYLTCLRYPWIHFQAETDGLIYTSKMSYTDVALFNRVHPTEKFSFGFYDKESYVELNKVYAFQIKGE